MDATAHIPAQRRHRALSWLPAVITIPVACAGGFYAFLQGINSAMTDGPPIYRHQDWLFVSFVAEVVFVLSAIALVVIGRLMVRGRRTLTIIGWLVLAASIVTPFACTRLAGPA